MKKYTKHFFALTLAALMSLSLLQPALASDFEEDNAAADTTNTEVIVTAEELQVPDEVVLTEPTETSEEAVDAVAVPLPDKEAPLLSAEEPLLGEEEPLLPFSMAIDLANNESNLVTRQDLLEASGLADGNFYVNTSDSLKTVLATSSVFSEGTLNVGTYYVYLQGDKTSFISYSVSLIGKIDVRLNASIVGPEEVSVSINDISNSDFDAIVNSVLEQYTVDFPDFADGAAYTVQYQAGGLGGLVSLDYVPRSSLSGHAFGLSKAGGVLEAGNTEELRITATNEKYPGISLVKTAMAIVKDTRLTPDFRYSPVTVVYSGKQLADDLLAAIAENLTVFSPETDDSFACTVSDLKITSAIPGASEQAQTITVRFAGNAVFAPASTDLSVYILKAPASLDVQKGRYAYDGTVKNPVIVATPEDLEYIELIAGIDGDAAGFLSLVVPKSVQDSMKIMGLIDIYGMLQSGIGDGITVKEFQTLMKNISASVTEMLSNPLISSLISSSDFDIESLKQILSMVDSIPTIDVNAIISLGNGPKNVGIYLVGAVSTDPNYVTAADMDTLIIAPMTNTEDSPVELRFNEMLPDDNTLTYKEAQTFDFGATLFGSDNQELTDRYIRYTYIGTDSEKNTYTSANAPVKPGVYIETVTSIGGNYLPLPILRTIIISLPETIIEMENAEIQYDGQQHGLTASAASEDGTDLTGRLTLHYESLDPEFPYSSNEKPTAAGNYSVTAVFEGDALHERAKGTAVLTITRRPVKILIDSKSKLKDTPDEELTYTLEGTLAEGDVLQVSLRRESGEDVGEYTITADVSDRNYDITVIDGTYSITAAPTKDEPTDEEPMEEAPTDEEPAERLPQRDDSIPKTGDTAGIGLYLMLMALSAAAFAMLRKYRKN